MNIPCDSSATSVRARVFSCSIHDAIYLSTRRGTHSCGFNAANGAEKSRRGKSWFKALPARARHYWRMALIMQKHHGTQHHPLDISPYSEHGFQRQVCLCSARPFESAISIFAVAPLLTWQLDLVVSLFFACQSRKIPLQRRVDVCHRRFLFFRSRDATTSATVHAWKKVRRESEHDGDWFFYALFT